MACLLLAICSVLYTEGQVISNTKRIARLILTYLQRNPGAGDTLEGITGYWLEWERIEISVPDVQEALEHLLRKGIISSCKMRDGTTIYRMSDN